MAFRVCLRTGHFKKKKYVFQIKHQNEINTETMCLWGVRKHSRADYICQITEHGLIRLIKSVITTNHEAIKDKNSVFFPNIEAYF